MPADGDTPRRRRLLDKGRMEGFSDGVFGFATTLLVVDIALHPPGTPLQQVLHAWPAYLAYVTSFLTIGGAWLLHTALTDRLTRVDQLFLRLNLLVLLAVVFLPFPTRLAAASHNTSGERVYVTMYGFIWVSRCTWWCRSGRSYGCLSGAIAPTHEPIRQQQPAATASSSSRRDGPVSACRPAVPVTRPIEWEIRETHGRSQQTQSADELRKPR